MDIVESLRTDNCQCHDGYKSRGRIDPQCASCQSKDERTEAAATIQDLRAALDLARNQAIELAATAARLRSELEAARKDAALYHILRDQCGIRVVLPNDWTVSEIAKGA